VPSRWQADSKDSSTHCLQDLQKGSGKSAARCRNLNLKNKSKRPNCSLKQQLHQSLLVPFGLTDEGVCSIHGMYLSIHRGYCRSCSLPAGQLWAVQRPLCNISVAKTVPGGRLAGCCAHSSGGGCSSSVLFVPGTPHTPPCPPGRAKEQVCRRNLQMSDYCTGYFTPKRTLLFT